MSEAQSGRPSDGWRFRPGRRKDELAALRRELAAALDRAARAEEELVAVRATATEESSGSDFGQRAEQILRVAESQARETRAAAAREAAALLQRTHAQQESHRHQVADELAARSADVAEREASLDARERSLVAAAEVQRRDLDLMRSRAVDHADQVRRAALEAAEEIRRRSADEVVAELRRLRTTHGATRSSGRPATPPEG